MITLLFHKLKIKFIKNIQNMFSIDNIIILIEIQEFQ